MAWAAWWIHSLARGVTAEGAARVLLEGPGPGDGIGEADGRDFGFAGHDAGDAFVVRGAGGTDHVVGGDARPVHPDVGEWHDAGDVADPPEALGGPARSVDVNGAASVDFGAGRVGVERFGSGASTQFGRQGAIGSDGEWVPHLLECVISYWPASSTWRERSVASSIACPTPGIRDVRVHRAPRASRMRLPGRPS